MTLTSIARLSHNGAETFHVGPSVSLQHVTHSTSVTALGAGSSVTWLQSNASTHVYVDCCGMENACRRMNASANASGNVKWVGQI